MLLFNIGMPTGLVCQLAWYVNWLGMSTGLVYKLAWYGLIFIV
jgi:hypothetical protein